jgi:hypothetical protein
MAADYRERGLLFCRKLTFSLDNPAREFAGVHGPRPDRWNSQFNTISDPYDRVSKLNERFK